MDNNQQDEDAKTSTEWLTDELRVRGHAIMQRLFAQESFPGQGWPYDPACPAPPQPTLSAPITEQKEST